MGAATRNPVHSVYMMLLGPVSKTRNAESAPAVQDPEGDSQSEEIGMADRLDNEMDEGSMDTDEEHDHDDEDEHPDHFSDEDDDDDDDEDGGEVELLAPPVYVGLPAGASLKVYLKSPLLKFFEFRMTLLHVTIPGPCGQPPCVQCALCSVLGSCERGWWCSRWRSSLIATRRRWIRHWIRSWMTMATLGNHP